MTDTVDSRMSLYEFHKPAQHQIDARTVAKLDYPLLGLSTLLFASSLVFLILGGFELREREDVKKSPLNTVVLGSALAALPSSLLVIALSLERMWHEVKQRRKHVKKARSSWSKRPILGAATIFVALSTILWLAGGLGLILTQVTVQPWRTRKLASTIDDWVGEGRKWEKGEQLGPAIFTSTGGVLQIPAIMALASMVLSTVLTLVQIGQFVVSKPESSD